MYNTAKVPRQSIKNGKVNVNEMVRKILGLEPSEEVPFSMFSPGEKRDYWAVANVFRRTGFPHHGRGTAYKTGYGMQLIYDAIAAHM